MITNDTQLRYFFVYKPYGMLCQFSPEKDKTTLAHLSFEFPKDAYPVGRLDEDSEGLLLITNDKALNAKLLNPIFKHDRTYLVQVDGNISQAATMALQKGVIIKPKDKPYLTLPAKAEIIDEPTDIQARKPPIRFRANIPTSWLKLTLKEGKNRQVRKMTAKVGYPTLRLIRYSIEDICLLAFQPGRVWELSKNEVYTLLKLH
ncbi:MAG: pseudouridine synthase [Cytophagales bacterium]